MGEINYSEALFQSVDQIVAERLKQIQFDRTIACEVVEAYPDENRYWVNCEGLKLEVSSIDPKKTYSVNSMVYVLVPNGNYENTKVIIGGYSTKDIEKKTYNNSYNSFIPNQTFKVIENTKPMSLGVDEPDIVVETDGIKYTPIEYNREYDYVGVHWSMQTYQLFDANITSGQYTLEIVFGTQDDDAIVSYPIESSSIYGNPYSLSEDFEQYTLFPYSDKLNECTQFKIRLYQGVKDKTNPNNRIDQFNYPEGDDNPPQIVLYSLNLSVGYANTSFQEEYSLNIGKQDSLNYKLNDTEDIARTLYFDWRVMDKNKNNQIFNYNNNKDFNTLVNNAHIYWLKYQENEGYQSFEELDSISFDYFNIEGLYNWRIIEDNDFQQLMNNRFKLLTKIDTDYQTDQYKIFIVYDRWITVVDEQGNEIQEQQSNYTFTNTIIFENLDTAPIQPGAATADKPNSLNLTLNEGNTGVYNVYGLDGRMVESSKQGPYYITASLFDSLQDKINEVEWIFPSSNTMVIDARGDDWKDLPNYDSENHNDKLTVKYRIKTQYYSSATLNTIYCKITMTTGEIRNASISLQFGEVGNQGTNYAFNIDFVDKDYLAYGQEEELQVKATLSNQNGEEILIEDFITNLEWSWLFVKNGDIISQENNITEITSLSNIICSKYKNNIVKLRLNKNFNFSEANYSILQAKLVGYNTGDDIKTDLLTYLCVPVAAADTESIKPRSMQGAARIVYDSLGTATTYSKETYEVINEDGTQVADLIWGLFTDTNYSGTPVLTESRIKNQDTEEYIIKYKIKPSSYVPSKIPPVSIVAKDGNDIIWSQPILITQNTWFNESINEWTNVLSINQEADGTILAPLLIAGTKTSNNLFTGVTVGQLAIGSKKVNGIYGFNQGQARFWLNEDADFYVGTGENHHISFNDSGGLDIVAKSFDFRTPEGAINKLVLSSINQEFQIGNENAYLKFYTPEGENQKKFEIKASNFEFSSTNYNGFNMRVGNNGFYTGTENEYISFEKEDGYYRALKIKAKEFDFTNDTIGLSITNQGITIGKREENSNYISLDSSGKLSMNLSNFVINTKTFNLDATNLKLSSDNGGSGQIGGWYIWDKWLQTANIHGYPENDQQVSDKVKNGLALGIDTTHGKNKPVILAREFHIKDDSKPTDTGSDRYYYIDTFYLDGSTGRIRATGEINAETGTFGKGDNKWIIDTTSAEGTTLVGIMQNRSISLGVLTARSIPSGLNSYSDVTGIEIKRGSNLDAYFYSGKAQFSEGGLTVNDSWLKIGSELLKSNLTMSADITHNSSASANQTYTHKHSITLTCSNPQGNNRAIIFMSSYNYRNSNGILQSSAGSTSISLTANEIKINGTVNMSAYDISANIVKASEIHTENGSGNIYIEAGIIARENIQIDGDILFKNSSGTYTSLRSLVDGI